MSENTTRAAWWRDADLVEAWRRRKRELATELEAAQRELLDRPPAGIGTDSNPADGPAQVPVEVASLLVALHGSSLGVFSARPGELVGALAGERLARRNAGEE